MCMGTSRAAAAVIVVTVTCQAGLRGGAGVSTWIAVLHELHVVWTFHICGDKHVNVAALVTIKQFCKTWCNSAADVCNSGPEHLSEPHISSCLHMLAHLQQKLSFLHCWGLPPAWTHCLENSEMVLQRTELSSSFSALHISAIQILVKASRSRRFWQLLNGALEKICSQSAWKNKSVNNTL